MRTLGRKANRHNKEVALDNRNHNVLVTRNRKAASSKLLNHNKEVAPDNWIHNVRVTRNRNSAFNKLNS